MFKDLHHPQQPGLRPSTKATQPNNPPNNHHPFDVMIFGSLLSGQPFSPFFLFFRKGGTWMDWARFFTLCF
jgi:hypothetical protein